MGRHETVNTRSEHHSPKVKDSIPVKGNFFAEFVLPLYNSGRTDRMMYLRNTSNEGNLLTETELKLTYLTLTGKLTIELYTL